MRDAIYAVVLTIITVAIVAWGVGRTYRNITTPIYFSTSVPCDYFHKCL